MKKLTTDNWLTADPIISSGVFVRMALTDGAITPVTAEDWTERLLAVQVLATVPDAVRDLVEIARAAMIYGSLFYPLFTLGLEQLFRVTEAAARAKAVQIGVNDNQTFNAVLTALHRANVLTDSEHHDWSNTRKFRNATTHATEPMILPPAAAIGMFATIVGSINRLFAI